MSARFAITIGTTRDRKDSRFLKNPKTSRRPLLATTDSSPVSLFDKSTTPSCASSASSSAPYLARSCKGLSSCSANLKAKKVFRRSTTFRLIAMRYLNFTPSIETFPQGWFDPSVSCILWEKEKTTRTTLRKLSISVAVAAL